MRRSSASRRATTGRPARISLRASERRARRVGDRPQVRRRRTPSGRRLLERRVDRRVHPSVVRGGFVAQRARRERLSLAGVALRRQAARVRRPSRSSRRSAAGPVRGPVTRGHSTRSRPGCCCCCPDAATRLAPCARRAGQALPHRRRPVGADVDRRPGRARSSSSASRRRRTSSSARLAGLRGEIELPIPAASAVKIGGERAYRLARRGVEVEMPLRRRTVYALDVIAYSDGVGDARHARRAREPTCGRSRRRSAGTAARCAARRSGRSASTRPTGPAAPGVDALRSARRSVTGGGCCVRTVEATRPCTAALARGGGCREGRASPAELTPRDARSRSARSTACTAATGGSSRRRVRRGLAPDGRHVRPASADRAREPRRALSTLERRLELLEAAGIEDVLVVEFTLELAAARRRRTSPSRCCGAIGTRVVVAGDGVPLRARRGGDLGAARAARVRRAARRARRRASRRRAIRAAAPRGRRRAAAPLLGRPPEVDGIVVGGDQRGGTLGFPTANLASPPGLLVLRYGIYAGRRRDTGGDLDRRQPALRRHRAADRGVPARLRRRSLRRAARRRALAAAARRAAFGSERS